jgi:hypothetical protein
MKKLLKERKKGNAAHRTSVDSTSSPKNNVVERIRSESDRLKTPSLVTSEIVELPTSSDGTQRSQDADNRSFR